MHEVSGKRFGEKHEQREAEWMEARYAKLICPSPASTTAKDPAVIKTRSEVWARGPQAEGAQGKRRMLSSLSALFR